MAELALTLTMKDHDHVTPLILGDVVAEGLDLTIERDTEFALHRSVTDPAIQGGELSFSRYLIQLSQGQRGLVAIPIFPERAFRHRCFFVLPGSGCGHWPTWAGKRVGTNEWPATGNTWSRAALRDQGVQIDGVEWLVGAIDQSESNSGGGRPPGAIPAFARFAPPGPYAERAAAPGWAGCPDVPVATGRFYEPDSQIVRLLPD